MIPKTIVYQDAQKERERSRKKFLQDVEDIITLKLWLSAVTFKH